MWRASFLNCERDKMVMEKKVFLWEMDSVRNSQRECQLAREERGGIEEQKCKAKLYRKLQE